MPIKTLDVVHHKIASSDRSKHTFDEIFGPLDFPLSAKRQNFRRPDLMMRTEMLDETKVE